MDSADVVRRIFMTVILLTAAADLPGCASSRLSVLWRDRSYAGGIMSHLLVVVVKRSPILREMWEGRFVRELSKRGVTATPSYRLFPLNLPDTSEIVQAARGCDGVLIVTEVVYGTPTSVPGYVPMSPLSGDPWYRTYFHDCEREMHAGYGEAPSVVRHEGILWTTKERGRMIWSGVGEIRGLTAGAPGSGELAELFIPELSHQGFIAGGE